MEVRPWRTRAREEMDDVDCCSVVASLQLSVSVSSSLVEAARSGIGCSMGGVE